MRGINIRLSTPAGCLPSFIRACVMLRTCVTFTTFVGSANAGVTYVALMVSFALALEKVVSL